MKKRIVLIALLGMALLLPLSAFADTGIGGIAGYGQPTGLSLKFNNFPVISLGWSLKSNWVEGTVDYWFINDKIDRGVLWYLGVGAKGSIGGSYGMGLRVPIGIQWYFMPRFEFFGEIVPGFTILPASGFDMSGGIGLRFHL